MTFDENRHDLRYKHTIVNRTIASFSELANLTTTVGSMGFFDSVRKAAAKAKVRSEIAYIDRQIEQQQHQFGLEFFTILNSWELNDDNNGRDLPVDNIAGVFHAAKEDVLDFVEKKKEHEAKLDDLEMNDGSTMSMALPRARIAYYDREIFLRKQIFGILSFEQLDIIAQSESDATSGVDLEDESTKNESKQQNDDDEENSNLAPNKTVDQDVRKVLNDLRRTMQDLQMRKQAKQRELVELNDGEEEVPSDMILTEGVAEDDATKNNDTTTNTTTAAVGEVAPPPAGAPPIAPPPAGAPPEVPASDEFESVEMSSGEMESVPSSEMENIPMDDELDEDNDL